MTDINVLSTTQKIFVDPVSASVSVVRQGIGGSDSGGGGGSDGYSFKQDTKPNGTITGQTWYNTATGQSFVWFDGFWVETAPGAINTPPEAQPIQAFSNDANWGAASGTVVLPGSATFPVKGGQPYLFEFWVPTRNGVATSASWTAHLFADGVSICLAIENGTYIANERVSMFAGVVWTPPADKSVVFTADIVASAGTVQMAAPWGFSLTPLNTAGVGLPTYEPRAVTTGFVASTGYTAANFQATVCGSLVTFRVDIARTGALITGHSVTGNVTDEVMGTMPAELRGNNTFIQPVVGVNLPFLGAYITPSTGTIQITSLLPGESFGPAGTTTTFIVMGTYIKDF